MSVHDSTRRFSGRVEQYVRWRPGYPAEVTDILRAETGLTGDSVVADIGSGTGISARLFLQLGCIVYGVEPNPDMRAAGEAWLAAYPGFRSTEGTAEATTLTAESIDYVVAAQAFHWFDPPAARRELTRILRPPGWVALMWNTRDTRSALVREYEELLQEFGTDYREVDHKRIAHEELAAFFGGEMRCRTIPHYQLFDRKGLRGRLLSSSYTPPEGHPNHLPMLERLDTLFDRYQTDGIVSFDYETELFYGRLSS